MEISTIPGLMVENGNMKLDHRQTDLDSKVHGANLGPIWGRQDLGGPHVGPMNFTVWGQEQRDIEGIFTLDMENHIDITHKNNL